VVSTWQAARRERRREQTFSWQVVHVQRLEDRRVLGLHSAQSGALRRTQAQSDAIRRNQTQSPLIRSHQAAYSAWTVHSARNQAQSDAIRRHQAAYSAWTVHSARWRLESTLSSRSSAAAASPRATRARAAATYLEWGAGAEMSTCMQGVASPRASRARYGATHHRERASLCGGASALDTARARSQSSVADCEGSAVPMPSASRALASPEEGRHQSSSAAIRRSSESAGFT
jgi:hypothetical protein